MKIFFKSRMATAKSIGWAINAAGFVIWLFGYVSTGHAAAFDWEGATPSASCWREDSGEEQKRLGIRGNPGPSSFGSCGVDESAVDHSREAVQLMVACTDPRFLNERRMVRLDPTAQLVLCRAPSPGSELAPWGRVLSE